MVRLAAHGPAATASAGRPCSEWVFDDMLASTKLIHYKAGVAKGYVLIARAVRFD